MTKNAEQPNRKDLLERAAELQIKGRTKMPIAELAAAVADAEKAEPTPEPEPKPEKKAKEKAAPKLKGAAAKLAWIQHEIGQHSVEKTGRNEHHGYDYFQEHGVLGIVKPLLEKVNAGVLVDFVDVERQGNTTFATLLFSVFDAELPKNDPDFSITARIPAEGQDNQDKGGYKLMTQAVKYGYQKVFLIPTEALEDVDAAETDEASTATSRKSASAAVKPIASQKAAALRALAAEAVNDKKIGNKDVTAYLTAEFRKNKVTDLTADEGEKFEAWLNDKIGG